MAIRANNSNNPSTDSNFDSTVIAGDIGYANISTYLFSELNKKKKRRGILSPDVNTVTGIYVDRVNSHPSHASLIFPQTHAHPH